MLSKLYIELMLSILDIVMRRFEMNLKEQMQELKEFFINIRTEDELSNETGLNIAHAIESDGWFHGVMALGIPYMGMLIPIIIVFIVFYFQAKENRDKYNALIEVSKNVEDPDVVEDLLNNFKEEKKSPRDYRRDGVTTLFTGIGLYLFGEFFLGSFLKGVGALVSTIGIGLIIAGYLYPRESEEINKAVEDFEKR